MTESSSSIAGALNITHKRGDTFQRNFTITDDDDNPIDLTGYTCRLQIRENASRDAVLSATTSNYISITGASDNIITVVVPASLMSFDARSYLWDLEVTSTGSVTETWLAGTFTLVQDITQ